MSLTLDFGISNNKVSKGSPEFGSSFKIVTQVGNFSINCGKHYSKN